CVSCPPHRAPVGSPRYPTRARATRNRGPQRSRPPPLRLPRRKSTGGDSNEASRPSRPPRHSLSAPWRVRLVPVHVPIEITCRGFMYRRRRTREICRHVVFEPSFANKPQQLLQPGNAHHTRSTECLERVVRNPALAHAPAHLP